MKDETTHCKGIAKDDGRVEQEKSKDEAAEFSGFRRRWRLLGWVVRSQRERERERERGSKTVKKRTCDEKRGDKRTWGVDMGRMTEGERGKAK